MFLSTVRLRGRLVHAEMTHDAAAALMSVAVWANRNEPEDRADIAQYFYALANREVPPQFGAGIHGVDHEYKVERVSEV